MNLEVQLCDPLKQINKAKSHNIFYINDLINVFYCMAGV